MRFPGQLEEKSPVKGDLHAGICGSRGVRFPSATRLPVVEEGPLCAVQVAAAKAVCARCPVRRTCLEDATERLSHGIAGGLTAEERRQARTEKTAHCRSASPRRAVRVAGLALIARGVSVSVVAEQCGVSGRTGQRWKARVSA